jgi:hypothetical protein
VTTQRIVLEQVQYDRGVFLLKKRKQGVYESRYRTSKTLFMGERKCFQMPDPFYPGAYLESYQ